jgi:hypothetical protein
MTSGRFETADRFNTYGRSIVASDRADTYGWSIVASDRADTYGWSIVAADRFNPYGRSIEASDRVDTHGRGIVAADLGSIPLVKSVATRCMVVLCRGAIAVGVSVDSPPSAG